MSVPCRRPSAVVVAFLLVLTTTSTFVFAKTGRNLVTEDERATALRKAQTNDWAKAAIQPAKSIEWVLAMSDEDLWRYIPGPDVLRALNVRFGDGCPVHGKAVFRKGGHYPWTMSREKPFQVTCPAGGETYPSNDFAAFYATGLDAMGRFHPDRADRSLLFNREHPDKDDPLHTKYVDDGSGWVDETGRRFYFVGHHVFWQRWQREVLAEILPLGKAYLFTDDIRYARKCAILLARIASEYRQFDYRTKQAYHNGRWPAGINGRILDYIWTTGVTGNCATAYDHIWPALKDETISSFLKSKGIDDARRHIEQNLLRVMAEDILSGFVRGNNGMHQTALARVALAWDNQDPDDGPTRKQLVDWILRGGGEVEELLWNGFYRDGHGGESSPGYSSGWCLNFYKLAALLEKLDVDLWSSPKLKKMADVGIELALADGWTPSTGDSGTILGSIRVGWSVALQGPAFRRYGDPLHAKVLAVLGTRTETLFEESIDKQIESAVQKHGREIRLGTRHLPGYGMAILESPSPTRPRGVSLYYGNAGGGHGHKDRLNIEYFDLGRPMLTDMGYPAHWLIKRNLWTSNSISHYTVLIDEQPQRTTYPGRLNVLSGSTRVQLMDASAEEVTYPGIASLYRRTTALIDIDVDGGYLVDIFRAHGGKQHDWSFHGPPFKKFSVQDVALTAQPTGTLAGPDVEFAQPIPPPIPEELEAGVVRMAEGDGLLDDKTIPYAERSLQGWASYDNGSALTRKPGSVLRFSSDKLPTGRMRLLIHAHDYNRGTNEITVRIGSTPHKMVYGQSGRKGYIWVPGPIVERTSANEPIEITADKIGQSYALIQHIGFTKNLKDTSGIVLQSNASSGFNYLYDVQHGKPTGTWSATWSNPESDEHLRVTMPDGFVQQLFVTKAEPELKPSHPKYLDYLVGRNVGKDLHSAFPVIVEAYKGKSTVVGVAAIEFVSAAPDAVALAVQHHDGTDRIISHLEATDTSALDDSLEWVGRFAVLGTDTSGGFRHACLIDGEKLTWKTGTIAAQPSPNGRVKGYDFATNTVTVDLPLPADGRLMGRTVFFFNDLHRTSYAIESIETTPDGSKIHLGDVLAQVGIGLVAKIDEENMRIETLTRFTGYGRVDGGQHQGRWITGEDRARRFKITRPAYPQIHLERAEALASSFPDANSDGRRQFYILDIGPGDQFTIPNCTTLVRNADDELALFATTDVSITLPTTAGQWSWTDADSATQHVAPGPDGTAKLRIDANRLRDGRTVLRNEKGNK